MARISFGSYFADKIYFPIALFVLTLFVGHFLFDLCWLTTFYYAATICGLALVHRLVAYFDSRPSAILQGTSFTGRHVLITGGSQGIGRALASEVLLAGGCVSIFARRQAGLDDARHELESLLENAMITKTGDDAQKSKSLIYTHAVDVGSSLSAVQDGVAAAEAHHGLKVNILVNCAGSAISKTFVDTEVSECEQMMRVNYFTAINATKACLPSLISSSKEQESGGHLVFVSSVAGLVGIFGFSAYSASKFALIGLAEALEMELKPLGIRVTVCLPPDTDTPGLAAENAGKPRETMLISEGGGLARPGDVARQLLNDMLVSKKYYSIAFYNLRI